MNDTFFKIRQVVSGWSGLMAFGMSVPLLPDKRRLRKMLATSESLCSRLPVVRIESLLGTNFADTESITLKAISCLPHNCSVFELTTLALLARLLRPKRVLEIGTYDGRSALAIASNLSSDAEIITLNLPPDYLAGKASAAVDEQLSGKVESGYRWRGHTQSDRIRQVFGNSLEYDFDQWKPVDMAFIDGGHSENIVLSDTRKVFSILEQNNGTILWHDATRYGVKPALEKLCREGHKIHLIAGTTLAIVRRSNGHEMQLD